MQDIELGVAKEPAVALSAPAAPAAAVGTTPTGGSRVNTTTKFRPWQSYVSAWNVPAQCCLRCDLVARHETVSYSYNPTSTPRTDRVSLGAQFGAFLCFPLICFAFAAFHDRVEGYIGVAATLGLMAWTGAAYAGQAAAKARSLAAWQAGAGIRDRVEGSSSSGCSQAVKMSQCWCVATPFVIGLGAIVIILATYTTA